MVNLEILTIGFVIGFLSGMVFSTWIANQIFAAWKRDKKKTVEEAMEEEMRKSLK